MSAPAVAPPVAPARNEPLHRWLEWLETIHPVSIDMGLDRVGLVADRLQLRPVDKPLVLVGGTNGKGSTVAMLSSIYTAAGYRTGAYTSPHIIDFRERIRINGEMADAAQIVDALAFVEDQRAPQTLTYFEYTTLAAMRVFQQSQCDVLLFEVGLGGRLDATNIWDADCSVITSIALDHEAYLGSDVRVIATEKAAIGRPGKKLVLGDPDPPDSLFAYARQHDIHIEHVGASKPDDLPETTMAGEHQRRNAGCALQVVRTLQAQVPVDEASAAHSLMNVELAARFEQLQADGVAVVMDVAHNPAASAALAQAWQLKYGKLQAQLIFASLGDKDIDGIVTQLRPVVAAWHCIDLPGPRASSADDIAGQIRACGISAVTAHADVSSAWKLARDSAHKNGSIVLVAGSFHTIADVQAAIFGATPA